MWAWIKKEYELVIVVVLLVSVTVGAWGYINVYDPLKKQTREISQDRDEVIEELQVLEKQLLEGDEAMAENANEEGVETEQVNPAMAQSDEAYRGLLSPTPTMSLALGENDSWYQPNAPTPTLEARQTDSNQMITATGTQVVEDETIDFSLTFPSQGGTVTGSGKSEHCIGTAEGVFHRQTTIMAGTIRGTCGYDEGWFLAEGTFEGNTYVELGYGEGTYEGTAGEDSGSGNWEIFFEPQE